MKRDGLLDDINYMVCEKKRTGKSTHIEENNLRVKIGSVNL